MNTEIDRRRHSRFPFNWPVTLMTPQGSVIGKTSNISLGGMTIILLDETLDKYLFGESLDKYNEMQVILEMPINLEIQSACEITWSDIITINRSFYSTAGARYTNISPADLELIDSTISEYSGDLNSNFTLI